MQSVEHQKRNGGNNVLKKSAGKVLKANNKRDY
jgi:hypothetical protein